MGINILDTLQNLVTGLGFGNSKTDYNQHTLAAFLDNVTLDALYTGSWRAGKIVDLPAGDMTRKGVKLVTSDQDVAEKMGAAIKKYKVFPSLLEFIKWGRLYGGCIILPVFTTDNPQSYADEFKPSMVRKGTLSGFRVYERSIVTPSGSTVRDPMSPSFLEPDSYQINQTTGYHIHHSRVKKNCGIPLSYLLRKANQFWGMSVLQRIYEDINNATTSSTSGANMVQRGVIDVMKIKGLKQMLSDDDETAALTKRWQRGSLIAGMTKFLLVDADEEEYEQKQNQTLSGVEGLITRFDQIVGSGADVPATRYLNKSPDGQNSTGNADLENYFEKIAADQDADLRPVLQWIFEIIYASEFGAPLPDDFSFVFESLYQPDQTELADIKKKEIESGLKLIEANIVPAFVVAQQLKDAGWYNIPSEHIDALKQAYEEPELPDETGEELENEEGEPVKTETEQQAEPDEPDELAE